MVISKRKFLLCLLTLGLFVALPLFAQDVTEQVDRYLGWMTKSEETRIWTAAQRLRELGENAVPIIKRRFHSLPEMAQVGCAKALIDLGEMDYALEELMRIIEEGRDQKAKMKAAELVGVFGAFDLEERVEKAIDKSFDPHLKIRLAKTLWQISRNPRAADILKSFLEVEDVDLQYAAALALGETQNVQAAMPILNRLRDEPTDQGRMARILLEKEALISRYERMQHQQSQAVRTETKPKYPIIEEAINMVKKYHIDGDDFTEEELVNQAVRGIVSHTDIHSAFWTKQQWQDFVESIVDEQYVGIGVYVGFRNNRFTIIAPIYSGPAYRAGLRSMDQIWEVNGWSTDDKTMEQIVEKIKGQTGSSVTLKVYRQGWSKAREFVIPREKVEVPSLFSTMLPGDIGYIRLTQFSKKATQNMEKALLKLRKQGMRAFVLDLRGNGGGWLQTAANILDKFIGGKKLLVYSEGRHPVKGRRYNYYSQQQGTHPDFPMAVLVDQSSASASEIVAGTLQHYKRAVVIGQQTYGKGSVQEPLPLKTRKGARVKLTIAKYYLPDGTSIHNKMDSEGNIIKHNGIHPDIEVEEKEFESWKSEEYGRLQEEKAFRNYIQKHYSQNEELFQELAVNDNRSFTRYPNFEEWFQTLNTRASKQDIRRWLRSELRRFMQDERGKRYACDYVADEVLQRAIIELGKKLGINLRDIPEYESFSNLK